MRIPILWLQKPAIKTAMREAILSKGKQYVPSLIISASLRKFRFVCLVLICLIGTCCTCAVFGVCADDDFLRNESTSVLFLGMLSILLSAQLKTRNQLSFRKANRDLPIGIRFSTFPITLSNQKCRTRANITWKNFQKSHLQGVLSLKILGSGISPLMVTHNMFLWRTDKKYPSIITSYHLDLLYCFVCD